MIAYDADIHTERQARIDALGYDYDVVPKERKMSCGCCGAMSHTILAERDRYGFSARYCECSNCGAVRLDPRPTAAAYADFYANWYRPLIAAWYGTPHGPEEIEPSQWIAAKCKLHCLRKLLDPYRGGTLLDLGGSTGIMASLLGEAIGLTATVIDPSPDELAKAEERGCATIRGTERDIPLSAKYDIITIWESIEHFTEPLMALKRCRAHLNPGGLILVDQRPFNELRANVVPVESCLKIDHPYYFTRHAMIRLIEAAQMEIVQGGVFRMSDGEQQINLGLFWYAVRPCGG